MSPNLVNYWFISQVTDSPRTFFGASLVAQTVESASNAGVLFSWVTQSCPTLCYPMDCSMPDFSITSSQSFPKLMSINSVMPSNHLILCHPLLLLPSTFPASWSHQLNILSTLFIRLLKWEYYASLWFWILHNEKFRSLSASSKQAKALEIFELIEMETTFLDMCLQNGYNYWYPQKRC